jgi:hypothetical protein
MARRARPWSCSRGSPKPTLLELWAGHRRAGSIASFKDEHVDACRQRYQSFFDATEGQLDGSFALRGHGLRLPAAERAGLRRRNREARPLPDRGLQAVRRLAQAGGPPGAPDRGRVLRHRRRRAHGQGGRGGALLRRRAGLGAAGARGHGRRGGGGADPKRSADDLPARGRRPWSGSPPRLAPRSGSRRASSTPRASC